jgi:hypothetical protein
VSYDDDIDAIPSLCDSCFGKLQGMEPTQGIGWKLLVFKCVKCGYEFCPHLESGPETLTCLDCAKDNSSGERKP